MRKQNAWMVLLGLLWSAAAQAAVPKTVGIQGRLSTAGRRPMVPTR
jgi:hypothetical protein